MKVVALLGSPRPQGNTSALLQEVLKTLETKSEVLTHHLNELSIKGCQSCYACKTQPNCVIPDDGKQVLHDISEADAVIFATPVYMWDMTAQTKLLIDRLYSFLNTDFTSKLTPGKKVLWIVTQGNPDENLFKGAFEKSSKMLQLLGFGETRLLLTSAVQSPSDVQKNSGLVEQANAAGEWLFAK